MAAHLELEKLPFPALTPAQRYHYEVYGFVVLPEVLLALYLIVASEKQLLNPFGNLW